MRTKLLTCHLPHLSLSAALTPRLTLLHSPRSTGFKADVQSFTDLGLDAAYLTQGASVVTLADYIVDPLSGAPHGSTAAAPSTYLKSGISACAKGTEAYWDGTGARIPAAGSAASYAAAVVKDNSCSPCASNMVAPKPGGWGG